MEDVIENWIQCKCGVGQHSFCGKGGKKTFWVMSHPRGDLLRNWGVCFKPSLSAPDLGKESCGGNLAAKPVFADKERGLKKTKNESMLFKATMGNKKCALQIMNKKENPLVND